jgi:hypothetical protein
MTLEIQDQTLDRHKNVAQLNQLMEFTTLPFIVHVIGYPIRV